MVDNERPVETYGAIKTTELSVSPRKVKPGEKITIKAKFRNTSHWFTSYTILFKFNGETIKKFTGWEVPGGTFTKKYTYEVPKGTPLEDYDVTVKEETEKKGMSRTVSVYMPPPSGKAKVAINTRPSGAKVKVSGRGVVGTTPVRFITDPGLLTVTIKKDGYKTIRKTFRQSLES